MELLYHKIWNLLAPNVREEFIDYTQTPESDILDNAVFQFYCDFLLEMTIDNGIALQDSVECLKSITRLQCTETQLTFIPGNVPNILKIITS